MCAKRVNREHPDYPVYIDKCRKIHAVYQKKIDVEEAKYPDWRNWPGRDHPSSLVIRQIGREENEELKKLQQEYSYLFIETGV